MPPWEPALSLSLRRPLSPGSQTPVHSRGCEQRRWPPAEHLPRGPRTEVLMTLCLESSPHLLFKGLKASGSASPEPPLLQSMSCLGSVRGSHSPFPSTTSPAAAGTVTAA